MSKTTDFILRCVVALAFIMLASVSFAADCLQWLLFPRDRVGLFDEREWLTGLWPWVLRGGER
jgi:hypothetical protein